MELEDRPSLIQNEEAQNSKHSQARQAQPEGWGRKPETCPRDGEDGEGKGAEDHAPSLSKRGQKSRRQQGAESRTEHTGEVDPAALGGKPGEGQGNHASREKERNEKGGEQQPALVPFQGHAEVIERNVFCQNEGPAHGNGAEQHENEETPGFEKGFAPAPPTTLQEAQDAAAGAKSEQHDADDHEGKVVPLGKGKETSQQHLVTQ